MPLTSPPVTRRPAATRRVAVDARAWMILRGGSREVLARIASGDPLGLRARIARLIRRECVLVDADLLFARALAHCARSAPTWRGQGSLDRWIDARVDEALVESLEPGQADDPADPADARAGSGLEQLARALGLAPEGLGERLRRFHATDLRARRLLFDLFLSGRPLERAARDANLGLTRAARLVRDALITLLPPDFEDPHRVPATPSTASTRSTPH